MLPEATFPLVAPTILLTTFVFERLHLDAIVFNVVATNRKVLRYHRLLREPETHIERNAVTINGESVDLVWFAATRSFWQENRARWEALAI